MNEIRISAKTVDDAITEASIQLGIPSSELEYEVIEKGSAGFLGIGMKQAVISARKKAPKKVEEVKPEVKAEAPKTEVKKETVKKDTAKKESHTNNFQKKESLHKDAKPVVQEEKKTEPEALKEEKKANPVKEHEVELAKITDDTKNAVIEFLNDTFKAMNMDVKVEAIIDAEGSLSIELSGENMGILIGKRGQTLDSLQYLANRVANKHQEGYVRVKLDTENYRSRRKATLENLAKNIAYKVKKSRKPISLEPMNPYERRIIHSVLQSDKYVTTHSEGEEPYRKIVVSLKK
ncbi:MAG: KH domain-containing protein [Lachnospiraceae bacterium]|nr:KH domain-containing protein [Lachnospiraceae bacterium]